MDSASVDDIVARLAPAVAGLKASAERADGMFWGLLRVRPGALEGTVVVFAEALGHVVYLTALGAAVERGLSIPDQMAVGRQVIGRIVSQTLIALPGFDVSTDIERVGATYLRLSPGSKREWSSFIRSYVAMLEALLLHQGEADVRRSGKLVLEMYIQQTASQALAAVEGATT